MSERNYREDFPLLRNETIAYLDNAATAQRPQCVLDAVRDFYEHDNANPLRGLYDLGVRATDDYENARISVQHFLNAKYPEEIIFTRNASESLNLIAYSYGLDKIGEGDEIAVSIMEHHSNLLPWQMVARRTGAKLVFLECEKDGTLPEEMLERCINERTKLVAVTHVSNVLGCTNPVKHIAELAHKNGAVIVVDAAQSVLHQNVDVQELDADFLVFSGHKLLAPMGIGALYGKKEILNSMQPFLSGGEMIEIVTRESATYAELPHKFEAGTVNAGGAVGLAAAIHYIEGIGFERIGELERALTVRAIEGLKKIPYVYILGSEDPYNHCGIVNFVIEGVHPHDVSTILNEDGVAVRAGHHCAQPLLKHLGVNSTTRASIAFYNTAEEIERLIASVSTIRGRMGYGE